MTVPESGEEDGVEILTGRGCEEDDGTFVVEEARREAR